MNEAGRQAVTSYLDSSALVKRYLVETAIPNVTKHPERSSRFLAAQSKDAALEPALRPPSTAFRPKNRRNSAQDAYAYNHIWNCWVEIGTSWVQAWWADPMQTIAVAEIGLVEIAAAFAGKLRGAHVTPAQYQSARADLTTDARDEYVLVTVNRAVVDEAIELTARYRLRGYDAVHLACALILNRALLAHQLPPLMLISADDDLLKAAAAEGLPTDNPNLYP